MKIRLLQSIALGVLIYSLSSCLSKVVLEDDLIVQQNEAKIQQYISSQKLTMQKATNGAYYTITKSNPTGRQLIYGDTVRLHYVIKSLTDSVIASSSVAKNQPFVFYHNGGNTNIFLKMLPQMREGEQATFILPSELAGGTQGFPNLPANSPVRCDITFFKTYGEEQDIDAYVAQNKISVTEKVEVVSTTTGYTNNVRYIRVKDGAADLVTGKVAKLKYTGRLLNGYVFDSNVSRTDSLNYTVGGTNSFVQGFLVGVAKMRLGEKATIIFPSGLGYGRTGSGSKVPGESPLIFDIEIVALKDK
ncbi:FKBP-type peptidyl-prolyl cis-trans isomerase [Arcicella sp. LKC2W]|uniref:FKBP-type peptidyl-prolyl cis-trans isomerase n=1 Tax=Arcicella sp. LKC2W TaxID=2984198 RepID=UPI002B2101D5|nr:FKBP-type peptidyl-prolyl cis-trans isomerase [Arcicella sp. LKC2W]MEA5457981.1 FKBP-type peptidyl-prolyl cis-trans isomerase [Arcicella sp. LKC2W]